ncbi:MAG: ArsI/CadI family heavy metal resistance metalloenzyme [Gammaproteobacteria bacterium]
MSRLHIHIAVTDLEQNIRFYSALFGAGPGVSKPDYAKWELADPAVNFAISTRSPQHGLDHIGIQAEDEAELAGIKNRLQQAGITGLEQANTACCYARSDKYWVRDPQGIAWETFHTLDSIPTFGATDRTANSSACCTPKTGSGSCC